MKCYSVILFLVFILFPISSYAKVESCMEAALNDAYLGKLDSFRASLCRGSDSSAPVKCFQIAYKEERQLSMNMTVELCRYAKQVRTPLHCFQRSLKTLGADLNAKHSVVLCGGADSIEETFQCYERARSSYQLNPEDAANLCGK